MCPFSTGAILAGEETVLTDIPAHWWSRSIYAIGIGIVGLS